MKRILLTSALALVAAPAWAALVTWQFNPSGLNQPVGSPTQTYTQSGFSLTVTGRDNDNNGPNGIDPFHQLYFKNEASVNGAIERGLGLVNTDANELNVNPDGSVAQYIQLDLRPLLAAGFINGEISVASMQNGEGFRLFGSNTQGALGTQLPGSWSGLAFDDKFVAIPNFGSFNFISVAALSGRILPVAFRADLAPIPEVGALLPIVGLLAAICLTRLLRRSRAGA